MSRLPFFFLQSKQCSYRLARNEVTVAGHVDVDVVHKQAKCHLSVGNRGGGSISAGTFSRSGGGGGSSSSGGLSLGSGNPVNGLLGDQRLVIGADEAKAF